MEKKDMKGGGEDKDVEWEEEKEVVSPHREEAESTRPPFEPWLPGVLTIVQPFVSPTTRYHRRMETVPSCVEIPTFSTLAAVQHSVSPSLGKLFYGTVTFLTPSVKSLFACGL